jgi:carbonic anhydrase/acetyltransferase-like protein (isoleucine patch superfamily)
VAAAVLLLPLSIPAYAVTLTEVQKVSGLDTALGDAFSRSFDIDGDTLVVGAQFADSGLGAVYVFVRNTSGSLCADAWCQQAKIVGEEYSEDFGIAVAIEGDTLFVGAEDDDRWGTDPGVPFRAGSVEIFKRTGTTWTRHGKLTASDKNAFVQSRFGRVLSVDGNVLAVTTFRDPAGGRGAVYIFRNIDGTWTQEAKLTSEFGEGFGATSVYNNTLVIGAPSNAEVAPFAGAVYVYQYDGTAWNRQTKLFADDAAGSENFGVSVQINADGIIVGAPFFFASLVYSGAAYIYTGALNTWTQQAKLTPSDRYIEFDESGNVVFGDAFGFGIALSGSTAFVSANRDNDFGADSGSVYVYNELPTGWEEAAKLNASDAAQSGWFGTRIKAQGDTVFFASFQLASTGSNPEGVYVFAIDSDDDGIRDSLDNCPTTANADQLDANGDGYGDACVDPGAISDNADIDPTVQLGENTNINTGVTVEENVVLEADVTANRDVAIDEGTTVQEGATLNQGSAVGADSNIGPNVSIGKNVFIGKRVVIGENTVIGQGSYVCSDSTIGANLNIGKNNVLEQFSIVTSDIGGKKNPVTDPPDPC